ncbi:MAG: SAM-dependent methyltransferase [Gammaproteobacteria bacterium]|nr:SAM-dependent methyltransferase [Gammaproteobacteria bacterium]MCF6363107.1 SAM-dependent methyltransferase [Gammaproteobacteria bacterium]
MNIPVSRATSRHTIRQAGEALARLPEPDGEAQAHSMALIRLIVDEITRAGGQISFARYMELALFAPGLGYYSAGSQKFGASGDFVTAPEISPLFSRCLARQTAEVLENLGGGDVLEVGAGSGIMAADLLAELALLGTLPEQYFLLELSADLRQRQRETLAQKVPHLLARVQWLDSLPDDGFRGVVLANELLDALPVHRFRVEVSGLTERCVSWQDGRFQWRSAEIDDAALAQCLAMLGEGLPEGYESELNLAAGGWIGSVAALLQAGVVLLIDYGFPRHEYYHPQRDRGTLMCHYRHRAHDDPFVYPGLQDITAHVDFTAVAECAVDSGLNVLGYNTQGLFLLANGITELPQSDDEHEQRRLAQQVRTLTLPGEMGELFKVMALGRDYDAPLRGFMLQDLRGKL